MTTHLALVGPTASGKSTLALAVAGVLGDVEIVSVDSMQVYRGLDVGTAKASAADRRRVPHHLIDVADPTESWSAARFQSEGRAAVAAIESRGHRALLVGGTGLYWRAVVDTLTFPGEDHVVRAALEAEAARRGAPALHARLAAVDPVAAGRIEPNNTRRIVRALEVIQIAGRPFSSYGPGLGGAGGGAEASAFPVSVAGVWLDRVALGARIDARVEEMRTQGLEDEVRALATAERLGRTARQAIGYKEMLTVVDGQADRGATADTARDAAFDAIRRRTRRLARRQRMWFRRDPRVTWLATGGNPQALAGALVRMWRR